MDRNYAEIFPSPATETIFTSPSTSIADLHHTPDVALESAISRLTLAPHVRPRSKMPSFRGFTSPESVSVPLPQPQSLFWVQPPSNRAAAAAAAAAATGIGIPSLSGSHHVGPETAPSPLNAMTINKIQDFSDDAGDNHDWYSLHGKKPMGNVYSPRGLQGSSNSCTSRSSLLYTDDQQLFEWRRLLTVQNMRGRIFAFATDKLLSPALGLKLEEGLTVGEIELLLPEVMGCLPALMTNQFGHNFVQKLFAACSEDQRTRIIMSLAEFPLNLINICLNSYGARAMQKLLEKLVLPQIPLVAAALSCGAVALATDPHGQHVIQFCIKQFPLEYCKSLFNQIADNCFKVSTNKSGCCVMQLCIDKSYGDERKQLIDEIKANALHLAEDPYGNYVVQYLLGMKMQEVTNDLLSRFQGSFLSLSCNKYASNVVEKFLSHSGEKNAAKVIMELVTSQNASMLLIDPYGNFVIQSALLSAPKGRIREALHNLIQVNAASMQSNLYGRKILGWFEKRKHRKT